MKPSCRRELVREAEANYRVSERRVCRILRFPRASHRYRSTRDEQADLRMRLKELAASRVQYGYRRLHILLRREGWEISAKRVYQLYREENVDLRTRTPRRRVSCRTRVDLPEPERIKECWAMDFMSAELFDGRRIGALTIVYHFSRESLAIEVGRRFTGREVAPALTRIALGRALPRAIRVNNDREFTFIDPCIGNALVLERSSEPLVVLAP